MHGYNSRGSSEPGFGSIGYALATPRTSTVAGLGTVAWRGARLFHDFLCLPRTGQRREPQIKAAFIYKFINYVQRPEQDPEQPLVIATVGSDPVNKYLRAIADSRKAGNRALSYQSLQRVDNIESCHIVFVADSVPQELAKAVLQRTQNLPVLVVGERQNFIKAGGTINFVISQNKVRVQLSLQSASKRDLKISSKLARIAEVID